MAQMFFPFPATTIKGLRATHIQLGLFFAILSPPLKLNKCTCSARYGHKSLEFSSIIQSASFYFCNSVAKDFVERKCIFKAVRTEVGSWMCVLCSCKERPVFIEMCVK